MKLPKKKTEDIEKCCEPWPYGLQLRFEKEQVDVIPSLEDYEVGEKVMITAEATVTSVRISERQNQDIDHTIEMQIEKISCEPVVGKKPEDMTMREYKMMRKTM